MRTAYRLALLAGALATMLAGCHASSFLREVRQDQYDEKPTKENLMTIERMPTSDCDVCEWPEAGEHTHVPCTRCGIEIHDDVCNLEQVCRVCYWGSAERARTAIW